MLLLILSLCSLIAIQAGEIIALLNVSNTEIDLLWCFQLLHRLWLLVVILFAEVHRVISIIIWLFSACNQNIGYKFIILETALLITIWLASIHLFYRRLGGRNYIVAVWPLDYFFRVFPTEIIRIITYYITWAQLVILLRLCSHQTVMILRL